MLTVYATGLQSERFTLGSDVSWMRHKAPFVTKVHANDAELTTVLQQIKGIRIAANSMREVTWFGDDAKFIAANLKLGGI